VALYLTLNQIYNSFEYLAGRRENQHRRWYRQNSKWKREKYLRVHPSVRQMPLGRDRDGIEYYFLGSASAVINDQNGIIGVGPGILKYHVDAVRLEAAMDIKGENEGALKIALLNVSKSK